MRVCLLLVAAYLFHCSGFSTEGLLDGDFLSLDTEPPSIVIDSPTNDTRNLYGDNLFVEGQAFDNGEIAYVEVSIDGGSFVRATGTNLWQHSYNTFDMESSRGEADKIIIARAFDRGGNSVTTEITVGTSHPLYVSKNGNDNAQGSIDEPFLTIGKATERAKDEGVREIYIAEGQYQEAVLLASQTSLLGGYDNSFLSRDMEANFTWIDSPTREALIISSDNQSNVLLVEGLQITTPLLSTGEQYGVRVYSSNVTLRNNHIEGRQSTDSQTRGVFVSADDVILENNYILAGQTANFAMGVFLENVSTIVRNNVIVASSSTGVCTGVYIFNNGEPVFLNNTIIARNCASESRGLWGRIENNAIIANNIIFTESGGNRRCYYEDNSLSFLQTNPEYLQNNFLVNCDDQYFDQEGGMAYSIDNSTTITHDPDGGGSFSSWADVGLVDISGNEYTTGSLTDFFTGTTFNASNEFKLKSGTNPTPIDNGLNSYDYGSFTLEDIVTTDLLGEIRTDYDIGAFEFQE